MTLPIEIVLFGPLALGLLSVTALFWGCRVVSLILIFAAWPLTVYTCNVFAFSIIDKKNPSLFFYGLFYFCVMMALDFTLCYFLMFILPVIVAIPIGTILNFVIYWNTAWSRRWFFFRFKHVFFPHQEFLDLIEKVQSSSNMDGFHPYEVSHGFGDCGGPIGNDYLRMLTDALKMNTTVQQLCLRSNVFDGHGVETLCRMLSIRKTPVTVLDLSSNNVGNRGAKALAQTMQSNTSIISLGLGESCIGADGIKALAQALEYNHTLESLTLDDNKIRNVHVLAAALKKNTTLKSLSLCNTSYTSLHPLQICNSCIGANGINSVFKALEQNQTLESLTLRGNNIRNVDILATALRNNTSLKTLWLCNNALGDLGVEELVAGIQENHSLKQLYLSQNRIGVRVTE